MRTCEDAKMRTCEDANMRTCKPANMRMASAGWVAFVLGGHWGAGETDVHLLALEGIYIDEKISAFQAEATATDSAMSFVQTLLN